jgi:hypothetical protein
LVVEEKKNDDMDFGVNGEEDMLVGDADGEIQDKFSHFNLVYSRD